MTLVLVLASMLLLGAGIGVAAGFAALGYRRRQSHLIATMAAEIEHLSDRHWRLAESEERYRSLIESQGDLIMRCSGGRIVYANAAYAALLHTDPAGAVGREIASLDRAPTAQVLPDGSRLFDEALALPDGGLRWISWVETSLVGADGTLTLQRVGRDISARIAGEQALEEARRRAEGANAAKSRFLATVSHEVRTPLNGILGMADLLADTRLTPEQTTYVEALKTSGDALLGIVEDILDFAKVEAGKLELVEEEFDLCQLVETVGELMAPRAQARGIEFASFLSPDLPTQWRGDRGRLRQILLNLVGNAVKFTDVGGVGLHVAQAGASLAITVSDTGCGIPEDKLPLIFEEFEQVDGSAARRHEGTGLGLAIVRRLVGLMGGTIAAENSDEGAVFRLSLPLRPAASGPILQAKPDWSAKHILIVSRAPFAAGFLAQAIAATGATVLQARDERRALRAIEQGSPCDAVLIDQSIGADAARSLAAVARLIGVRQRLIVMSPFERRQFGSPLADGFTGFLVKPVRNRSLYEQLGVAAPVRAAPPPALRPAADPALPALRVLVAEDNEINGLLITRMLERLGCRPVWVRNGQAALAAAKAALSGEQPALELILLDIRMPELDGLAVARAIRAFEAELGCLPRSLIVAVSANTAAEDCEAARSAGMDDCLPKPISRETLARLIAQIGERRRSAEQPLSA